MSFRTKLMATLVLLVLPFVASEAYFHYTHYVDRQAAVMAEQDSVAEQLGQSFDVQIQHVVSLQQSVGRAVTLPQWSDPQVRHRYIASIMRSSPTVDDLAFISPSGVITDGYPESSTGVDVSSTGFFREISGGAVWTATSGGDPRDPGIVVATGIRDDRRQLLGIVTATVNGRRLEESLHLQLEPGTLLFLTDSKGQMLYLSGLPVSGAALRQLGSLAAVKSVLRGKQTLTSDFTWPDGVPKMGAIVPIQRLGWAAGALVPRDKVLQPVFAVTRRDVTVTVAALIIALVVGLVLARQMVSPISRLADAAEELGKGRLHTRAPETGASELAALAHTLNSMAESLQQRDQALQSALKREQRAAREASALYGIAEDLVGSLQLDERLEALAEGMAVIASVEVCLLYLVENDNLAPGTAYGLNDGPAAAFREHKLVTGGLAPSAQKAMAEGVPVVVNAPDPATQQLCVGETECAMLVPIKSDGDVIGLSVLYTPGQHCSFDDGTVATETTMAQLAFKAVINARAFEREQRIATILQRAMLPSVPQRVGRAEVATAYFPVMEEAEVGGDFYDVMTLPDGKLGLLIADVSGKGLKAAVHTAMTRYMAEGFAYHSPNPAEVLARINSVIRGSQDEWTFITAFLAILDTRTGQLSYANAGHPPPLVVSASGVKSWLDTSTGPPLGVAEKPDYLESATELSSGDVVVCYTDGVVEARHADDWFGSEGLESQPLSTESSPEEIVRQIYQAVGDFSGGNLRDDIALVAVKMLREGICQ